jgi:hypothetical protein
LRSAAFRAKHPPAHDSGRPIEAAAPSSERGPAKRPKRDDAASVLCTSTRNPRVSRERVSIQ